MRDCTDGSARRTVKPSPRSAVRGTITVLIASHWYLSPAAGSWPGKKLMVSFLLACLVASRAPSSGKRHACLSLERSDEAVEHLVDLVPARQLFHPVEPSHDIRIRRKI